MVRKLKGLTRIPEKIKAPVAMKWDTPSEIRELGDGYRRVLSNYLDELEHHLGRGISQADIHNKFFGYLLRVFYANLGYDETTTFSRLIIKLVLNNSFKILPFETSETYGRTELLILAIDALTPNIEMDLKEYGYDFTVYGTRKRDLRERETSVLTVR